MTDQELKDIVAAVVAELEKSGVDFDYKADQAKDDDLVFVIRGTAPNYQGVTVTWKGLLDIITAQATQAKNDAETAKNAANTILEQVQSKGTEITNFVATSKAELETQKNESVNAVKSVYQTDLNELKGDLVHLSVPTENIAGLFLGGTHVEDFDIGAMSWVSMSEMWDYITYPYYVRTKEGILYSLQNGDIIRLSDYTDKRFWVFCKKPDGTFYQSGWKTEDYILPYDGEYAFLVSYITSIKPKDANELCRYVVIEKQKNIVNDLHEKISLKASNLDVFNKVTGEKDSSGNGMYEYPIKKGHTYIFRNTSTTGAMNCGTREKNGTSNIETVCSGLTYGKSVIFKATIDTWGIYVFGNSAHSFMMQDTDSIEYRSSYIIDNLFNQNIGVRFCNIEWVNKTFDSSVKDFTDNPTRIAINGFFTVDETIFVKSKIGYLLSVVECAEESYDTRITGGAWTTDYIRLNPDKYYIVVLRREDNGSISIDESNNIFWKEVSSDIFDLYKTAFNSSPMYDKSQDINSRIKEYCSLFNDTTGLVDSFVFFTDPHLLGTLGSDIDEDRFRKYISTLQKVYNSTPTDYIVSGGDWLNSKDTQEQACYKLGYADAVMRSMFDNFYHVSGNHDTNYQGKLIDSSDDNTGVLTLETQRNLWFRNTDTNNLYYSFDSRNSKHYVFNTGTDWDVTMNVNRWEQIDWFATSLIRDDALHSSVFMHIIVNDSTTGISYMATEVGKIISAYNEKTTITANGKTYDFSQTNGHVDYVMGGHMHSDMSGLLGGVPYIITTTFDNVGAVSEATFDLCLADYGNGKLHCVRVGVGNSRVFDI